MLQEKTKYLVSFEDKTQNALFNIDTRMGNCSKTLWAMRCFDCGNDFRVVPQSCFIPYCRKCAGRRFARNYMRLLEKGYRSERMFHMVIGFPLLDNLDNARAETDKQRLILRSFFTRMRKLGFKFRGLRCRDIAYDRTVGKAFIHYHFAMLGEKGFNSCARVFNAEITKCSKGVVRVVKLLGYRVKKGLLRYFAMRQAGVFGHDDVSLDKSSYGYSDIMGFENYVQSFHDSRVLVNLGAPTGLGSKLVPDVLHCCPKCGSSDVMKVETVTDSSVFVSRYRNPYGTTTQQDLNGGLAW